MLDQGENVKMDQIENEEMEKEETRVLRREKDMFWAECAVFFHRNVSAYHFLHNCVADIYADLLKFDIEFLNLGEVEKISLAAKWCPSINSFYDRRTQICESIAKAVFPFDSDPGKNNEEKKVLLPHEIVASLRDKSSSMVAESKWESLVNYLKKKGSLKNCLAVYGISRDMTKMQKDICVSMGLLVSELSEEPWKGKIVSFGDDPKIRMIQGSNLPAKIEFMRQLDYCKVENIKRVLDQIFEFALAEKISQEKMPQKIFVFTDMGLQQVSA
ncbi:hypothetical protein D5086_018265 [Populus alba]|uniref:Uncharacterized protein n=1 Tax=Populus alba TaxID=43335 RepID=A0ACC4BPA9_POPAL